MRRGELWVAEVGRKRRPVLLLTRSEVLDARALVTVAEITTSIRGLAAEVAIDHIEIGLDRPSVVNCDGLHTIAQASLTGLVGRVGDDVMRRVCSAVSYALGC
ncbi:MAG TPA: type II toxin-antitoxin system PemK/MazF family toxin [Acidimicrobiales bacterium]|nr:type II toxin-antitoxin system PemK/MazF family toxin [Acidimicrobiales bacterium]